MVAKPRPLVPTLTAAPMFRISPATSASTRLGVCSSFGAIVHLVNASYNVVGVGGVPNALSEISGHPDDKWGGAVNVALQIKNIPTGAGDDFKIDATYSKGDTKAVISTSGGSPSFAMFGQRPSRFVSEHWLWPNV